MISHYTVTIARYKENKDQRTKSRETREWLKSCETREVAYVPAGILS